MAYNITFAAQTQGAESVESLRAKVLLMQQQYQTAASEVRKSVKAIDDATRESAKAAADGNASRAASQQAAANTERQALEGLIAKQREVKAQLDQLTDSNQKFAASTMEARAAVQALNGNFGTMAAGRWLAELQGLGPVLHAAFMVAGPLAFLDVLGRIVEKIDPTVQGEKEIAEQNKKLAESYVDATKKIQGFIDARAKATLSPEAYKKYQAGETRGDIESDKRQIESLKQQSADLIGGKPKPPSMSDLLLGGPGTSFEDLAKLNGIKDQIKELENDIRVLGEKAKTDDTQSDADKKKAAQEAAKKAAEQALELAKRRASTEEELRRAMESAQAKELSGYDEIRAKLQAIVDLKAAENTLTAQGLEYVRQTAIAENTKYSQDLIKRTTEGVHKSAAKDVEDNDRDRERTGRDTADAFLKQLREDIAQEEKGLSQTSKIQGIGDQSDADGVRRKLDATLRKNTLTDNPGQRAGADYKARTDSANEELKVSTKRLDIDKLDADARDLMAGKQVALTDQEFSDLEKLAAARKRYADEVYQAEAKYEEDLQAIREKDLKDFQQFAGSIFDALASRNPMALRDLLHKEILTIGSTITQNLAKDIWPVISKAIPHAGAGTPLGNILQGTPLGPDPLKVATDANTTATQANTAALSRQSGGNSISGGAGVAGAGSGSGGSTAGGSVSVGDTDLDSSEASVSSTPFSAATVPSHGFGFNIGTIGTIAAMGASAYAAAKGFERGGALSGAGGVLGAGAGIAAMIPGGQPVAAALAVGGMALSLLGGFLNSPQQRANQINNELGQNQYIAPQALNVTQSSNGTFADFDARGNLRTSTFSPYPTVTQGFEWEQTHGLFDGPPTYYNVPGGQTGQFGAPVAQTTHIYQISAVDTQSFGDALQRNSRGVGDAAATALQNAHGRLTSEVQRAAKP